MLSKKEGGREKPFTSNFQLQIFSMSWDCPAFLQLEEGRELLMPGEDACIKLHMQKKMVYPLCSILAVFLYNGGLG